jgi:hypothetical protein
MIRKPRLGILLEKHRTAKGFKRLDFARKCDLSYEVLYNLETRGQIDVKLSTLITMCNVLKMTIDEFLEIGNKGVQNGKSETEKEG